MTITTDDPTDPRLTHGPDDKPVPKADVYLVLSAEARVAAGANAFYGLINQARGHKLDADNLPVPSADNVRGRDRRNLYHNAPATLKRTGFPGRFIAMFPIDLQYRLRYTCMK